LLNADTVTAVTLASTGSAATASVGSYPLTISGATGTGLSNYSISYVEGTLTVNAAPLTITATSEQKTYGSVYSLSAYTVVGLMNSDKVTSVGLASSGVGATVPVGSYPITVSSATGTGLTNYAISYVPGALTVNAALLTITPNAQTKIYGTTLIIPGTAFSVTGLLNSDTVTSVVLVSPGTDPSATVAGGPYLITASGATGTGLSNYSLTYNTALLTVQKSPVSVSSVSSLNPSTYGDKITWTFTVTGSQATPTGSLTLTEGETVLGPITLTNGVGTYDTSATVAGAHNLVAAYSGDSNYY
jgi:hypothetical protein